MRTRVQKWGNSLALRIPKACASEAKLSEDTTVEISVMDGRLVVQPAEIVVTLAELVKGITKENRHREWDVGPAQGREVW